jgi:hypothetical protein
MEKISISPWHLCRQHLAIIARKVKEEGIREIGRRAKESHTIVARFSHTPEAVGIQSIYRIADAVGMTFRLEIQPNLPGTSPIRKKATSKAKGDKPEKPPTTPRRRDANVPPTPRPRRATVPPT